jgi:hypothetical protein
MFFSLVLLSINVSAHSPSNMSLSYNNTTKELQVDITHQVSNPNTHYVYNIVVKINGETNISQDYTSQPGSSFTYSYEGIEVIEGDIFEVTALCNQGGSITRTFTVSSGEVSETGDDDSSTPGFELTVVFLAVALVLLCRRKRV